MIYFLAKCFNCSQYKVVQDFSLQICTNCLRSTFIYEEEPTFSSIAEADDAKCAANHYEFSSIMTIHKL